MSDVRLSAMAGLLLGLVAELGPCTSYELKSLAGERLAGLRAVPHALLYSEPERLVALGLLVREVEPGGRHRKLFGITTAGSTALRTWLAEERTAAWDVRDGHLLRAAVAAGAGCADVVSGLARERRDAHDERLAALRSQAPHDPHDPDSLAHGLALRLEAAGREFWAELADAATARPDGGSR
jgi:PadR family transcriptional regulator, regulatory protein AphA